MDTVFIATSVFTGRHRVFTTLEAALLAHPTFNSTPEGDHWIIHPFNSTTDVRFVVTEVKLES